MTDQSGSQPCMLSYIVNSHNIRHSTLQQPQSILAWVKLRRLPGMVLAIRLLLSRILLLLILTDDFGFFSFLRATITGTLDLVTR